MASTRNVHLLFGLFCLLRAAYARVDSYNVYYLDDFCHEYFDDVQQRSLPFTISLYSPETPPPTSAAIVTRFNSQQASAPAKNCTLIFSHSRFTSQSGEFALRLTGKTGSNLMYQRVCSDLLTISIGQEDSWNTVYDSCNPKTEQLSFTTARNESIRIRSEVSEGHHGFPFDLTVTAVKEVAADCNGLFACKNGLCVNKRVACDGRDNCGDGSDEGEELECPPLEDDHDHEAEGGWLIIGLVLGGFVLAFLLIALSIILIARRYGHKIREKDSELREVKALQPEKHPQGDDTHKEDVTSAEFKNIEPPNVEIEAQNPLYESADNSPSSN